MELDFEQCYRAVDSRDQRFDGWFYTAVTSTGIYCRPSCPAVTPKPANVRFYPSAAAAQRAGFRACRRCRPDAAPGSPAWDTRTDLVGRAMRLISDGVVDRDGVPGLARRLGYTERHLHRVLTEQVGAGPLALARAQRAQTARILVETTDLDLAAIAFAAGFGSVRQFNDTFREVYGSAPARLRTSTPSLTDRSVADQVGAGSDGGLGRPAQTISLRLAHRQPLHAAALLEFLAAGAIPGVETVDGDTYRRIIRLPHETGAVTLTPTSGYVAATLRLTDLRDLAPAVARCRRLLDLDADPVAVDAALAADPALAAGVTAEPGVRVPRAMDGFELAVRAVVGQRVSVAGARRLLSRLCLAGGPQHPPAFPRPAQLLDLPDDAFGMPAARRATLRELARVVAGGELDLDAGGDRDETLARLTALPGIGPWTAGYVAMRGLGDPDVLLATDLGVQRGARGSGLPADPGALTAHGARWRPWRSYATVRLWRAPGAAHPRRAVPTAGRATSRTKPISPASPASPASEER